MSRTDERRAGHARRFSADGDFAERLGGAERRRLVSHDDIIRSMALSRRDRLVDLGAGIGYFSVPASRHVREVIALDIEQKMFGPLRERIASAKRGNIELIRGDIASIPLADGSADHVLAAFVYHEVDDPELLVRECARVLRPDGQLTVVDFQKRETSIGPPVEERKTPEEVRRGTSSAFEPVRGLETEVYYALRFRKR